MKCLTYIETTTCTDLVVENQYFHKNIIELWASIYDHIVQIQQNITTTIEKGSISINELQKCILSIHKIFYAKSRISEDCLLSVINLCISWTNNSLSQLNILTQKFMWYKKSFTRLRLLFEAFILLLKPNIWSSIHSILMQTIRAKVSHLTPFETSYRDCNLVYWLGFYLAQCMKNKNVIL